MPLDIVFQDGQWNIWLRNDALVTEGPGPAILLARNVDKFRAIDDARTIIVAALSQLSQVMH